MSNNWQLPLIINDISKHKFNELNKHSNNQPISKKKANKQNKPLYNVPSKRQLLYNHKTNINLNHLRMYYPNNQHQQTSFSLEVVTSQCHNFVKTLPPIITVTAPNTISLLAFQQIQKSLKNHFKGEIDQQILQELRVLKKLLKQSFEIIKSGSKFQYAQEIMIDPYISLLYNYLSAQIFLRQENTQTALKCFRKAKYFSLLQKDFIFCIYCIVEEANIMKNSFRMQQCLECLKMALGISLQSQNINVQVEILQKIGMFYCFVGNTTMGQHYHRLAEHNLNKYELQYNKKLFDYRTQLAKLKSELFQIDSHRNSRCGKIVEEEQEINENIQGESLRIKLIQNNSMISHMLKNNQEKFISNKLRRHIRQNINFAQIISHTDKDHKSSHHSPINVSLPFINNSQVLKSHLSRNRGGKTFENRQWNLKVAFQVIDSIVRFL